MKTLVLVLGLALTSVGATADDSLVRFDGGNATVHISDPAGVPLDANGNVEIDDVLTPTPPSSCDSPALLIATPGTHHWFAAGIPKADDAK